MPIFKGKDQMGTWVKWGRTGRKYYYDDKITGSIQDALDKVYSQMRAIKLSQRLQQHKRR